MTSCQAWTSSGESVATDRSSGRCPSRLQSGLSRVAVGCRTVSCSAAEVVGALLSADHSCRLLMQLVATFCSMSAWSTACLSCSHLLPANLACKQGACASSLEQAAAGLQQRAGAWHPPPPDSAGPGPGSCTNPPAIKGTSSSGSLGRQCRMQHHGDCDMLAGAHPRIHSYTPAQSTTATEQKHLIISCSETERTADHSSAQGPALC